MATLSSNGDGNSRGFERGRLAQKATAARDDSLQRDAFSSNRHHALDYCLGTIFSENRRPLSGIMRD
jgi:hypothetical protein